MTQNPYQSPLVTDASRPTGVGFEDSMENRRLSSSLTLLYKLGFSTVLVAIGVAAMWFTAAASDIARWVVVWSANWTMLLLVAYACLRLKKVVAWPDHLVVSNYLTACRVPYEDIEEIKGYRARSVVFVRLRLRDGCRFGRRIHFLLPSIFARVESQPEIQLLREKCPRLCEQSGSRFWGTHYFRPKADAARSPDEDARPTA